MINITDWCKDALKKGKYYRGIEIAFPNSESATLTSEDVINDSVSFTESLCSSYDGIKFGLAEQSSIEFNALATRNLSGAIIDVNIIIYDEEDNEERIPLGRFVVDECKRNADNMAERKFSCYTYIGSDDTQKYYSSIKLSARKNLPISIESEFINHIRVNGLKGVTSIIPYTTTRSTHTVYHYVDTTHSGVNVNIDMVHRDTLLVYPRNTGSSTVDDNVKYFSFNPNTRSIDFVAICHALMNDGAEHNPTQSVLDAIEYVKQSGAIERAKSHFEHNTLFSVMSTTANASASVSNQKMVDVKSGIYSACENVGAYPNYAIGYVTIPLDCTLRITLTGNNLSWSKDEVITISDNPYYKSFYSLGLPITKTYKADKNGYITERKWEDIQQDFIAELELCGCFGKFDRYGNFGIYQLNKLSEVCSEDRICSPTAYVGTDHSIIEKEDYSSAWYDDYTTYYSYVSCTYNDGTNDETITVAVPNAKDNYGLTYDFSDNVIIQNGTYTSAQITTYATTIAQALVGIQYYKSDIDVVNMPYIEDGDMVEIVTNDGAFMTYVFRNSQQGINYIAGNLTAE